MFIPSSNEFLPNCTCDHVIWDFIFLSTITLSSMDRCRDTTTSSHQVRLNMLWKWRPIAVYAQSSLTKHIELVGTRVRLIRGATVSGKCRMDDIEKPKMIFMSAYFVYKLISVRTIIGLALSIFVNLRSDLFDRWQKAERLISKETQTTPCAAIMGLQT